MSLRNRIVVAGLLLTLTTPVAGWGVGTVRDPDGQPLEVATVPVDESERTQPRMDGAVAAVRTKGTAPQEGMAFVLDRFHDWLRGLFASSL